MPTDGLSVKNSSTSRKGGPRIAAVMVASSQPIVITFKPRVQRKQQEQQSIAAQQPQMFLIQSDCGPNTAWEQLH